MTAMLTRAKEVFGALCPHCAYNYSTTRWPGQCPTPGNEPGGAGE